MYNVNNVFSQILKGKIPARFLYENEVCVAFSDIAPLKKVHILVIPKGEYISFDDFIEKATKEEVVTFWSSVREIAHAQGLDQTGYRLVTNHGDHSGQEVSHFHVHILGGEPVGAIVA